MAKTSRKTNKSKSRKSQNWRLKTTKKKAFNKWKKKTSFKKKGTISQGKPKKEGTGHWLSFGAAVNRRPVKLFKGLTKMLAPNFQLINAALQVLITPGIQAPFNLLNAFTPADITALITPTASAANVRVMLESCTQKAFGTNQSNGVIFMDLYDMICRRDLGASVNPVNQWNSGNTDEGNATASGFPGSTPFQSERLTQFWKILKVTRYNLNPGETFEHIKNIKINKLWNHELDTVIAPTVNTGGLRNITHWTMGVAWSAPYNDVTTKTSVTLGSGALDFVVTKQYRTTQLSSASSTLTATNSLSTTFAVAEDIMNDDSGVAAAYVQA